MRCFCVVIWILLSEVAVVVSDISVSGHVGGSVTIQCPHLLAKTNTKYFCRDPCKKDQDILIKSGQSPTGRYTLKDSGKGDFTVTITDLQTSDAGTYWCGVDRLVKDTYSEVLLTVTDATPTAAAVRTVRFKLFITSSSTISSSSAPKPTFPAQHSLNISSPTRVPHEDRQDRSGTLLYTAAGLVAMLMIFGLGLIVLFKCKRATSEIKGPCPDSVYAEVKTPQTEINQPSGAVSSTAEDMLVNTLYSTVELHNERPDSQIYSLAQ
ncbi:CMRF35-like molecule 5 [Pygocentrus nattereri]|uniref:Immunoglobulin domain-containing protein n=1 Tax=Pygocentrus nattereri TaxID=42514 RepID=A0A3B4DY14_PYGNA|nr:CMRF35-like molecule 5 [Pygocentrus nattereri]